MKNLFLKKILPGEYIIQIAKKIIDHIKVKNLVILISVSNYLKRSLKHSMDLIKLDLKKLGIEHDNFSESKLIEDKLVDKAVNQLKK